jgi:hypothetical protein
LGSAGLGFGCGFLFLMVGLGAVKLLSPPSASPEGIQSQAFKFKLRFRGMEVELRLDSPVIKLKKILLLQLSFARYWKQLL